MKKKARREVVITTENLDNWPKIKSLVDAGKVKADSNGRLRYLHGAPVGKMILMTDPGDPNPRYNETADEWFDPDSPKAASFVWP